MDLINIDTCDTFSGLLKETKKILMRRVVTEPIMNKLIAKTLDLIGKVKNVDGLFGDLATISNIVVFNGFYPIKWHNEVMIVIYEKLKEYINGGNTQQRSNIIDNYLNKYRFISNSFRSDSKIVMLNPNCIKKYNLNAEQHALCTQIYNKSGFILNKIDILDLYIQAIITITKDQTRKIIPADTNFHNYISQIANVSVLYSYKNIEKFKAAIKYFSFISIFCGDVFNEDSYVITKHNLILSAEHKFFITAIYINIAELDEQYIGKTEIGEPIFNDVNTTVMRNLMKTLLYYMYKLEDIIVYEPVSRHVDHIKLNKYINIIKQNTFDYICTYIAYDPAPGENTKKFINLYYEIE